MGAIAARGGSKAFKLFRDVLAASASVPVVFAPQYPDKAVVGWLPLINMVPIVVCRTGRRFAREFSQNTAFCTEVDVTDRLFRIAIFWLLLLATAWVAEPYLIALWGSATAPRTVTPRGERLRSPSRPR